MHDTGTNTEGDDEEEDDEGSDEEDAVPMFAPAHALNIFVPLVDLKPGTAHEGKGFCFVSAPFHACTMLVFGSHDNGSLLFCGLTAFDGRAWVHTISARKPRAGNCRCHVRG